MRPVKLVLDEDGAAVAQVVPAPAAAAAPATKVASAPAAAPAPAPVAVAPGSGVVLCQALFDYNRYLVLAKRNGRCLVDAAPVILTRRQRAAGTRMTSFSRPTTLSA